MRCNCGEELRREVLEGFCCDHCGKVTYWNPPTIGIAVVPVEDSLTGERGVLLIERADGGLAFPGGFQVREDIYAAIARELIEETGIELSPWEEDWQFFDFSTTPGAKQNLFFALYAGVIEREQLDRFTPNNEVVRLVFATSPMLLKFSLHQRVLGKFFELQRVIRPPFERTNAPIMAEA